MNRPASGRNDLAVQVPCMFIDSIHEGMSSECDSRVFDPTATHVSFFFYRFTSVVLVPRRSLDQVGSGLITNRLNFTYRVREKCMSHHCKHTTLRYIQTRILNHIEP
jgi:hypothetical protein